MAFMGILMVMGIFTVLAVIILLWVAGILVGGALEGVLVSRMGKAFSRSGPFLANNAGFVKACKVMGWLTTIVCGAAFLSGVTLFILTLTDYEESYLSPWGAFLGLGTMALVVLGFLLFLATGVLLVNIYRRSRRQQPPPIGKGVSIVCLVLGIINFVAGGISVLTLGILRLIFGG